MTLIWTRHYIYLLLADTNFPTKEPMFLSKHLLDSTTCLRYLLITLNDIVLLWNLKACHFVINYFIVSLYSLISFADFVKVEGSEVTVVAFLIFPTKASNFNVESLRGQAIAKQLRDTVSELQKEIGQRIFESCLRLTFANILMELAIMNLNLNFHCFQGWASKKWKYVNEGRSCKAEEMYLCCTSEFKWV